MSADKTIPAMLLTVFLVIAIPAGLYFRKLPTPALSPAETEVGKFTCQPVDISLPQPPAAFSGLECPIAQSTSQSTSVSGGRVVTASPPPVSTTAGSKPTPPRSLSSLPVVSMISYDSATRTAIVGDRVVTEGSELDGGKILKIEENRVLMRKAGKNIWLTVE
jgi:hypothetical protein